MKSFFPLIMNHNYNLFAKNTNQHEIESKVTAKIISEKFTQQKIHLLDVGCGSGLLLKKIVSLTNKKFVVDFLDPDGKILSLFKKTFYESEQVVLSKEFNGKVEDVIDRLDDKYDLILCGHSLYYPNLSIIRSLINFLKPHGMLIIHISQGENPTQKLFSVAIKKNDSKDVENFLSQNKIDYTKHSQVFVLNVTKIKEYLENSSNLEGKQFLDLFVYSRIKSEVKDRVKTIINNFATVKNGNYFLDGKSDIYSISKTGRM